MSKPPYRIAILGKDPWILSAGRALTALGHTLQVIDIEGASGPGEILAQIGGFRPHFCFGRNYYPFDEGFPEIQGRGYALENFLEGQKIPCALWYLDNPASSGSRLQDIRWKESSFPKNLFFFCMDRHHLRFFHSQGVPAAHLQIAIDDDPKLYVPRAELIPQFRAPISFVGAPPFGVPRAPETEAEIRALFEEHYRGMIFGHLKADMEDISTNEADRWRSQISESLRTFFGRWYATASDYAAAKGAFLVSMEAVFPPQVVSLLFKGLDFSYSFYQLTTTLHRLQSSGIRIYGGEDWKGYFKDNSSDCRRVDFHRELPTLMAASRINFCYTKWQFLGAVHERPLISLACGSFPLTDHREEINEMFQPGEIVCYHSPDEALELTDYYLRHETERQAVIAKGRARVFSEHTYLKRMETLLQTLRDHGVIS